MKSIYMAIWYKCNQKCTGCPIENNSNKKQSISAEEIGKRLDEILLNENDRIEVTLSGGEPTLHPQFFDILDEIMRRDMFCTILTNAEKFGNKDFCDEMLKHVNLRHIRITTTIHGSNEMIHEEQNHSSGSFNKSIAGLQYLSFRGVAVSIKHCITKKNIADTADFISMVNENFHPSVSIQLWGIDYSGLDHEQAKSLYMPFYEMQPYIEKALDLYLNIREINYREISLNNLPLCSVDPYYWDLMPNVRSGFNGYSSYLDPTTTKGFTPDDSGKYSSACTQCDVNQYCQGAYRSLFEYFGDETVHAIRAVE